MRLEGNASADSLRAFVPGETFRLEGAGDGPLAGLTFAAKDVFDIAGRVTGAGSPEWRATHGPARKTATAVARLLDAGATLVGKTQMNELAYGSLGQNAHYGTPVNPKAPDRVPGGSSSGSASAVAGGAVDFALGSDSACSVRLPAALCGILGFRPTLARVPTAGMVPLSPSLDTVGWFARDSRILETVGKVLLDPWCEPERPHTLLIAADAFEMAAAELSEVLKKSLASIAERFPTVEHIRLVEEGEPEGLDWFWFRVWSVQVREVWATHGSWIESTRPNSRVLSRENLATGADSTPEEEAEARRHWDAHAARVRAKIPAGSLLCLPTAAGVAPLLDCDVAAKKAFLQPSLCLLSVAGVAGLPQVNLPAGTHEGSPVGLSLVGAQGSDEAVLRAAVDHLSDQTRPTQNP